jgi:hypothetical protein
MLFVLREVSSSHYKLNSFYGASIFNADLSLWNVKRVTSFYGEFSFLGLSVCAGHLEFLARRFNFFRPHFQKRESLDFLQTGRPLLPNLC